MRLRQEFALRGRAVGAEVRFHLLATSAVRGWAAAVVPFHRLATSVVRGWAAAVVPFHPPELQA